MARRFQEDLFTEEVDYVFKNNLSAMQVEHSKTNVKLMQNQGFQCRWG